MNEPRIRTNHENPGSNMLWITYLDSWLQDVQPNLAKSTFAGYRNCVRVVKRYFERMNLTLAELRPMHLQEFYRQRMLDGVTASTVLHYHANIHKALKRAVKMELISSNQADKVELPKKEIFIGNFYSQDEVQQLFQVFKGDVCELCIHIAAFYGLRRSEIIGLKWNAIDFINKTISIQNKVTEALDANGNYELVIEPKLKNQSSRRTLPLMPHIEQLLLDEKKKQEQYRNQYGSSCFDEYVCRKKDGDLIRPGYLSEHFKYVLKQSGLRTIRLHDLRHTCASLMLKNGVLMKQIQEWLGHSNFATTANIYSHLDFASKIQSAKVIEQMLIPDSKE